MFSRNSYTAGLPASSLALINFSNLLQAAGQENNAPWWLLWLLIIIALLSAVVWWFTGREGEQLAPAAQAPGCNICPVRKVRDRACRLCDQYVIRDFASRYRRDL